MAHRKLTSPSSEGSTFQAMLDAAPDAMIGVDTEGRIVMVNVQTEALFGYPREDLLGQPIELLVPDPAKAVHQAHRGKYFREPLTRPMGSGLDLGGRRADGTEFPAEISLSSIQTEDGPVVIAAVRNITDRKKAEATFQAMLDAAPDAMVGVSRDGTIVLANEQTEAVFGYRRGELVGQPVETLVPDRVKAVHPAHRESYFEAPRTRPMGVVLDLAGRRADGTEFPAEISLNAIETGEGTVALAAIRDITDRTVAEEETRRAREEADRANHAKSEFLSRVSHELRTPLNSILGFAQLLEMEEITGTQRKSVKQIRGGGEHLLGLIDEILDIEKIASGKMTFSPEPVHVGEVLREVLQLVLPIAEGGRVRLVAPTDELDVHVKADRQRLKQVLLNLLSNALKFNHVGGEVRITSRASESSFQLSVSDTGVGIEEELMVGLFTPFDRLGAERRGIEGTGLGLALSKSLIEAMNGTIDVTSVPGEGSTFRIELPLTERTGIKVDEVPEEVGARDQALLERTILYVEDNLANLQLIQGILDYRPTIRLLSAMQGSIALELSKQHRPDLILLDLHLPDMSGEEVLEQLGADGRTRDIPVVIVSADASRDTIKRLERAGVRSYVTKPINVSVLLRMFDEVLG
ncbi:MAG TPA: PAS domain S-box protein [Actinomycetota bacterium]|nr:PAS domain S-box protein [Actinomycetota bacterium]